MINIRPVSDLRNKYPEIEKTVLRDNEEVFDEMRRMITNEAKII